jgi:hypothetical protein
MKSTIPSVEEFRDAVTSNGWAMLDALDRYVAALPDSHLAPRFFEQALPGLGNVLREDGVAAPTLILTSPPYPGVYVIYHRWKLMGRKEIPAPYWIADRRDGHGISHYTMAARAEPTQDSYFRRLREAYADIAQIMDRTSTLVQVVGFNNIATQLPRYLDAMAECGLAEVKFDELATDDDGRLWRSVPGRRWWTQSNARKTVAPHTSREVVLIHRLT